MAITKIHPIKSTLKKAIDYIADPAKTDDKLLVSSFGCAVETADLEFEKTRLLAMQKGNNLFIGNGYKQVATLPEWQYSQGKYHDMALFMKFF